MSPVILGWAGLFCILCLATFGPWGCLLIFISLTIFLLTMTTTIFMVGKDWSEDYWNKACISKVELPNNGIPTVKVTVVKPPLPIKFDKRITGSTLIDEPLQEVLQYTLRDYVHNWYQNVSADENFLGMLQESMQKAVIALSNRMKEVDWVHFLTIHLVEDFASHLRLFRQSQQKLYEIKRAEPKSNPNLFTIFFDLEREKDNGVCFSSICMSAGEEKAYLEELSDVLLYLLMEPEDFKCKPYRFLVRELFVNALLLPTVNLISDPDYINQTILWLCSDVPITSEGFVTILRSTNNTDELMAVREKIQHEIAIQRSRDSGGDDDTVIKQQLSSLLFVKRVVDHRLQRLQEGIDTDSAGLPSRIDWKKVMAPGYKLCILPLDIILKNNVALSYFIDFMTSLGQQAYMFFYLTVEAYRVSSEQQLASIYSENPKNAEGASLDSIKQAAISIFDQYLSAKAVPRIKIDEATLKRLYQKIQSEVPSESWFDEAQMKVLDILSDDRFLGAFRKSTQYIKMLAELDLLKDASKSDDEDVQSLEDLQIGSLDTISVSSQEEMSSSESSNSTTRSVHSAHGGSSTSGSTCTPLVHYKVVITGSGVVRESLKPYIMYALEVIKTLQDGQEEKWQVFRRYSDFHDFHMIIQGKFGNIASHLFPGKRAFNNLNPEFLEKRKQQLNDYFQFILKSEVYLKHSGLLEVTIQFLEPIIYKSRSQFARKMDRVVNPLKESIRNVSHAVKAMPDNFLQTMDGMMDGLSKMLHNKPLTDLNPLTFPDRGCVIDLESEEDIPLRILLILVDEVFDLKSRNQWLRRRIVVLLRQFIKSLYGDRINRKIIDYVQWMTMAEQITEYIRAFRQAIWPNGILAPPMPPRDDNTKMRARVAAKMSLICSLPDEMKHIIGSETTRKGVLLVFEMFQLETLNRRLLYVIIEEIIKLLFPHANIPSILQKIHSNRTKPKSCN